MGFVVAADPLEEKLLTAEDRVAYVRAAVISFNIAVYLLFLDPAVGVPWLAWTIIVVASVYAVAVFATRMHRHVPVLMSGWFTTTTDSALIAAWIIATGGIHSPFYLLWFVSLAAIAFRFGMRETFAAAGVYIVLYVGLVAALGQLPANFVDVGVRTVYMVFTAVLVALLAHESTRQWLSRAEFRRVAAGEGGSPQDAGVTRNVDMDQTLRSVTDSTRAFVRADRAAIYLMDDETKKLRCAYSEGLSDHWIAARTRHFQQLPGIAVLQDAPYLHISDARSEPGLEPIREAVRREGIRTYAVFPLKVGDMRIGLLSLYRDRVEPFTPHEIELGASLADRAAGTIANARLVKELSESEARLQKVLSNAPVVLFATDRDGYLTLFEGEGTKLLDLKPSDVIGRHVNEVYADHEVIPKYIERALSGQEFVDDVTLDGKIFSVHYAPVRDDEGEVDGVIGVAVDVTERKRIEKEQAEREKEQAELEQLREIDLFKTLFINTAAHELRTPLTPIKVQFHLLRSGGLDGLSQRQRHSVNVLERNIDRLGDLVEDILEGARIQAGRLSVQKHPVALDRVVREAVESFVDPARETGVTLESDLQSGLVVPADPKRVVQVLFNLLSNALKFTPEGGTIRVDVSRDGDAALVRVTDTGAGLTKKQVQRLFRPFSQVHDPMHTIRGGTGLGLYISRSLVELHGGEIWCESPGEGKGSTFAFRLPFTDQTTSKPGRGTDWEKVARAKSERDHEAQGGHDEGEASGLQEDEEILSPAEKDRLARRARELV